MDRPFAAKRLASKSRVGRSNSCSMFLMLKKVPCGLHVATNARPFLRRRTNSGSDRAVATNAAVDSIGWLGGLEDVDESKLKIESGDNSSVVASAPVADGEVVASIPGSVWLTRQAALKSPIGQYIETLDPWLSIAIFLIHERKNKESMWADYIELLCSKPPSTPILWTDSEVELLKGTQIWESVYSYRNFYKETYEALRDQIFEPNADVFPLNEYSQEDFLWAACIVRALSHSPLDGENIAIVPTLESLAHKRGERANVNFITSDSVSWNGVPKQEFLVEWLQRRYDLLIKASKNRNDSLEYLVASSNCLLKSSLVFNDQIDHHVQFSLQVKSSSPQSLKDLCTELYAQLLNIFRS